MLSNEMIGKRAFVYRAAAADASKNLLQFGDKLPAGWLGVGVCVTKNEFWGEFHPFGASDATPNPVYIPLRNYVPCVLRGIKANPKMGNNGNPGANPPAYDGYVTVFCKRVGT